MVPTKYKGFCARLGPHGKRRSLQGLLESSEKNWVSHPFFQDMSLNKIRTSTFFLKKKEKIFLRLYIQESEHIYKDLQTARQMVP